MSAHPASWRPLKIILIAAMVIPPITVVTALPWLKQQPDEVGFLFSGIASAVTILASFAFSILSNRQTDEWHRRAAQFSSRWGWTAGAGVVALLLALPAVREAIVPLVRQFTDVPSTHAKPVRLAFVFGFMAVVLMQTLCTLILSIGWAAWMSRKPRNA